MNIRVDKQKALGKWGKVLESMGVTDLDRKDWMSEYAELHAINENAYANASNVAGMGNVVSSQPSLFAGTTIGTNWSGNGGTLGSGDVAQNLLPVAMKIAAQTIGLDLVAVKPSPGPKIDLLYIDFQYDETQMGNDDERPQVFKITSTNINTAIAGLTAALANQGINQYTGGIQGQLWFAISELANSAYINANGNTSDPVAAGVSRQAIVQFLGFSRIDGLPMFRAYRKWNTAQTNIGTLNPYGNTWVFDQTRNTFGPTGSMASQIMFIGTTATSGTMSGVSIELVSTLEDHIPGFSSNWTDYGAYPMARGLDDSSYSGIIGTNVSTKTIAVGTIEVSSALRRTEIEDIKANTGMDIVQKMESILVNELSQTISKQIVWKIFELGEDNRGSAPLLASPYFAGQTVFDLSTNYALSGNSVSGPGGETTHAVQRKLITKMVHASNFIATEGRIGPAQFAVTNGGLAAALQDIAGYTINPSRSKMNTNGQLYPVGQIGDIQIYVDPYMKYNDDRIAIGRKNNPDQPGIIFVPYLMAQSISIISEATFAPRLLLRSRYAVSEVGWFPQKQYMTIHVQDPAGLLN